jgi:hypothetical protein
VTLHRPVSTTTIIWISPSHPITVDRALMIARDLRPHRQARLDAAGVPARDPVHTSDQGV